MLTQKKYVGMVLAIRVRKIRVGTRSGERFLYVLKWGGPFWGEELQTKEGFESVPGKIDRNDMPEEHSQNRHGLEERRLLRKIDETVTRADTAKLKVNEDGGPSCEAQKWILLQGH